jgi:hypothetical protein
MTDKKALKLALDALDIAQGLLADARSYHQPKMLAAYTAIKQALAQPEQEPVAWMDVDGNVSDNNDHKCFPIPLYTHPPQRTEQNFCSRCGKRTPDLITIHTCTPPKD